MTREIYIITRNKGKLLAAQKAFSQYGIEVKAIDKEYPEIQADTSIEIARFIALQAAKEFKVPVIREDHSLYIRALGKFPGPYTNYFDRNLFVEQLLNMLKDARDRTGHFDVAAVYAKPDGTYKDFIFQVPIKISKEARGKNGNWDKILMLEKSSRTFAETKEEDNVDVWNKNYLAIAQEIMES